KWRAVYGECRHCVCEPSPASLFRQPSISADFRRRDGSFDTSAMQGPDGSEYRRRDSIGRLGPGGRDEQLAFHSQFSREHRTYAVPILTASACETSAIPHARPDRVAHRSGAGERFRRSASPGSRLPTHHRYDAKQLPTLALATPSVFLAARSVKPSSFDAM